MRFFMPNYPCEFEIPDEWWAEAGMATMTAVAPAYCSTATAELAPLREIEPPCRTPWTPKDWCGFDHDRLVRILNDIATGVEIEPVPLVELPVQDFPPALYRYRVGDGFHRFYASVAAGFECLPAVIS